MLVLNVLKSPRNTVRFQPNPRLYWKQTTINFLTIFQERWAHLSTSLSFLSSSNNFFQLSWRWHFNSQIVFSRRIFYQPISSQVVSVIPTAIGRTRFGLKIFSSIEFIDGRQIRLFLNSPLRKLKSRLHGGVVQIARRRRSLIAALTNIKQSLAQILIHSILGL